MELDADLRAAAARNNARWCDAMARAHGAPGAFATQAWINRHPAPRLYPNLVTLGGPTESDAHRAAIGELAAAPPAPGWAVKDSFAALDLAPLGLRPLFEASWIHWPVRAIDQRHAAHRVSGEDELAAWERAWAGANAADAQGRLFRAALLSERDHAIMALTRRGAIVAGCIVSRSDNVVGMSNVFAPAEDDGRDRMACLAAALRIAPGLPLVGYEHGEDLARMKAVGFEEIGPLRIWQAS